ncbi:sigma-70 family RNA polymerase sigma factor [Streptomyces sp. NPDC056749]|uniref:sigma-70 family RNA polymerase sigma factor n=1 Tax=Streptomyces sp. NPDC056749 TaxID=3345936 RepID=UPI0036A85191
MSDAHTARRPGGPGNRWELVWSHRDEMLEIAHGRSSSAEEAEDAVHEAMIRAVEDPDVQYGRLRSWLRHATVRACADRHRQVTRDRELSETLSAAPAESLLVEEGACDRAEARWLADRSVELLPARQAQALRLQAQDLDVGQVARTMGLSYRATESLLARARRSMRNVLARSLAAAAAVWVCVRRFPRTGFAQSTGATSAAVTLAVAGAVLPAGSFDRPDDRPPESRSEPQVPRTAPVESLPAATAARSRPHPASPSPDPHGTGRSRQGSSRSVPSPPEETRRAHELPGTVAVEISIDSGTPVPDLPPVPELPPAATPTSMPSLPVDWPEIRSPELPSAPAEISAGGLGVTAHPPQSSAP